MRKIPLYLGLVLAALAPFLPGAAAAGETKTRLELYPLEGGSLLYIGDRVTVEEQGRVTQTTVFRKAGGGGPILREVWIYDRKDLRLVSQKLENPVSGQREELTRVADTVKMLARENGKEEIERKDLPWEPQMAYSAIVVPTMVDEWSKLAGGGTVAFDLLVASRLGTVGFRLKKDSVARISGEPVMVVRMEPSSWLIRRLVDPLYFFLAQKAPHRLVEFKGRSSIRTDDGDTQDLRTVFRAVAP
ncbi:MAG: hypothetical protein V3S29_08135 [bacterium]